MQHGIVFTRLGIAACITVAVLGAGAVLMAQGASGSSGGSLSEVSAELRQLRLAIEEATRRQTQTQAMGVYLSVQQSRLLQVSARLDAARRELDTATGRSRDIATELSNTEDALARGAKPELKSQYEMHARNLRQEMEKASVQLQQAQMRETELSQMLQSEEARWTDLITKLEALIKN